jgi:hypothetical protein
MQDKELLRYFKKLFSVDQLVIDNVATKVLSFTSLTEVLGFRHDFSLKKDMLSNYMSARVAFLVQDSYARLNRSIVQDLRATCSFSFRVVGNNIFVAAGLVL